MRCGYYRWKISRALDDDDSAALPHGHMAGCEACRRFYRQSLLLIERLRADAMDLPAEAIHLRADAMDLPAHLTERAVAARAVTGGAVARPRRRLVLTGALAAAASIALAVAIGSLVAPRTPTVIVSQKPSPPAAAAPQIAAAMPDVLAAASNRVDTLANLAKRPILDELDHTTRDARAAQRALLACLPIDLAQTSRNRAQ